MGWLGGVNVWSAGAMLQPPEAQVAQWVGWGV